MARILVADDEQQIRAMVRTMLERAGHEVACASDGNQAVAMLRRAPVDVLVVDVIMPGKEGIETLIEARQARPEVKVIVMSGGGRAGNFDYLEIATRLGAAHTLRKPFRQRALLDLVERCLGGPGPPGRTAT